MGSPSKLKGYAGYSICYSCLLHLVKLYIQFQALIIHAQYIHINPVSLSKQNRFYSVNIHFEIGPSGQ